MAETLDRIDYDQQRLPQPQAGRQTSCGQVGGVRSYSHLSGGLSQEVPRIPSDDR